MITIKKNRAGVTTFFLTEQPKTSRLEKSEAVDFYQHAMHKRPGINLFHVANESVSKMQHRKNLKQAGVKSGVSDYLLLAPNSKYNFLAIELKRARKSDSSVSANQNEFIKSVENMGGFGCVCYGYQAALLALDEYLKE